MTFREEIIEEFMEKHIELQNKSWSIFVDV